MATVQGAWQLVCVMCWLNVSPTARRRTATWPSPLALGRRPLQGTVFAGRRRPSSLGRNMLVSTYILVFRHSPVITSMLKIGYVEKIGRRGPSSLAWDDIGRNIFVITDVLVIDSSIY